MQGNISQVLENVSQVTCMSTKVNKRFVVNKVVCDQRRKTNVCRSIPWLIFSSCPWLIFSMVDIFQLSRSHTRSSGPNAPLAVGRSVGWSRGLAVPQSVTSHQSVRGEQSTILQKVYKLHVFKIVYKFKLKMPKSSTTTRCPSTFCQNEVHLHCIKIS